MRTGLVTALVLLVCVGSAGARTIVGTERADVLTGTPSADALFGLGGADRILGGKGADLLDGGPGPDFLSGGPGNDRIAAAYDGSRDTVHCGPGADVVNADALDRVAADCELVSIRISRDPYTNPESQHQSEVEPSSYTAGHTTVATFQVGRRFDGGAANIGTATSLDDGKTWRSGLLPSLTQASVPPAAAARASDPVVSYDAVHSVWLVAALVLNGTETSIRVSRSSDGLVWSAPVVAADESFSQDVAYDKEWIACDNGPSSPFHGRCYVAYSHVSAGDSLAVQSTADGGLTWSRPTEVPVPNVVGALPEILPSGKLVVVYVRDDTRIAASVSTDGAVTFAPTAGISDVQARPATGLRLFALPSAAVDPTGRIWVTWHDCRFSTGCTTNDVVVSMSSDGVAWTAPVAVTTGRNAFIPAIGIEPSTGRVAIAYYVVHPAGIDAELVESGAGGNGFGSPRRLSAETMPAHWLPNTVSGRMLADYISVSWAGARPLVVWALASTPVGASLRQAIYATRG